MHKHKRKKVTPQHVLHLIFTIRSIQWSLLEALMEGISSKPLLPRLQFTFNPQLPNSAILPLPAPGFSSHLRRQSTAKDHGLEKALSWRDTEYRNSSHVRY